jgi:hypothetical protein
MRPRALSAVCHLDECAAARRLLIMQHLQPAAAWCARLSRMTSGDVLEGTVAHEQESFGRGGS